MEVFSIRLTIKHSVLEGMGFCIRNEEYNKGLLIKPSKCVIEIKTPLPTWNAFETHGDNIDIVGNVGSAAFYCHPQIYP